MNRQSKTKKGILIAVIIACLIALIGGTYARYTSSGIANASAQIAKWHVTLNGTDISSQSENVNVALRYAENSYVKNGKIAPGSNAYFEVVLDPTGSEVAIDYTFNIDSAAIANALGENSTSQIAITGATYTVEDGSAQDATINNGTVSVSEALADVEAGKSVTVRVGISWDNANDANNASDTAQGVASYVTGENGKTITIPVGVTAQQHI